MGTWDARYYSVSDDFLPQHPSDEPVLPKLPDLGDTKALLNLLYLKAPGSDEVFYFSSIEEIVEILKKRDTIHDSIRDWRNEKLRVKISRRALMIPIDIYEGDGRYKE